MNWKKEYPINYDTSLSDEDIKWLESDIKRRKEELING